MQSHTEYFIRYQVHAQTLYYFMGQCVHYFGKPDVYGNWVILKADFKKFILSGTVGTIIHFPMEQHVVYDILWLGS